VPIDTALFRTVQPHYTAAPLFIGMNDPLPRRSGFWKGLDDVVCFPIIEAPTLREKSSGYTGSSTALGFEGKLELLGDQPLNPRGQGFHKSSPGRDRFLCRNAWRTLGQPGPEGEASRRCPNRT
jgi:hypothetical protein